MYDALDERGETIRGNPWLKPETNVINFKIRDARLGKNSYATAAHADAMLRRFHYAEVQLYLRIGFEAMTNEN
jgi:hypothetical protein